MEQTLIRPASTPNNPDEFTPFPNMERRNWLQSRLEIPAMVAALSLPKRARVLEVGCGRGIAIPVFARLLQPTRLVALDIEQPLLDEAGDRATRYGVDVELVQGDVRALPFEDGEFDLVIDFGTCYHVAHPDRALTEIHRVLAPGGLFATETKLSQVMAHPIRTMGRWLPWHSARLPLRRHALLWQTRSRA